MIRVHIEGVGVVGPGLAGWESAQRVLCGREVYAAAPTVVPSAGQLPGAEGRRTGLPVKLALAVAHEAFAHAARDKSTTPTVFTSSSGDGDNVHQILEILASDSREVSPTRFHNSVHNAAAGYWSIAARSREASTSLCGYDASFAAGLLDAAGQVAVEGRAVALIAYDQPYPEPLYAKRPVTGNFALALVLTPGAGEHTLASIEVEITRDRATPATTLAHAELEALRNGVPAARALPLLSALARGSHERVVLEYVAGASLTVNIAPCR